MPDFSSMTLAEFLDQAASDAPVPGGGGIAALAGALGASMASMAANFTVGRPKFAEHDALMRETIAALKEAVARLLAAVDGDAAAFSGISAAYRLPKNTDDEKAARKAAVDAALAASMRVPLGMTRHCLAAAKLLPPLAEKGNPNLLSDVAVAAILLGAAAEAALVNILVNAKSLDTPEARGAEDEGKRAVADIADIAARTKQTARGKNGAFPAYAARASRRNGRTLLPRSVGNRGRGRAKRLFPRV